MSLREAVMAELAVEPGISHHIYLRLDRRLGDAAELSDGLVRLHLRNAVKRGEATVAVEDGHSVFTIAEPGRERVSDWLAGTDTENQRYVHDLALRLLFVSDRTRSELRAALDAELSSCAVRAATLRAQIETARQTGTRDATELHFLEYQLAHLAADLTWLADARELLAEAALRTRKAS